VSIEQNDTSLVLALNATGILDQFAIEKAIKESSDMTNKIKGCIFMRPANHPESGFKVARDGIESAKFVERILGRHRQL